MIAFGPATDINTNDTMVARRQLRRSIVERFHKSDFSAKNLLQHGSMLGFCIHRLNGDYVGMLPNFLKR